MSKDARFLKLAKKESTKSNHADYKIGCVITKKSQIIATGYNLYKTHTKSPHPYKSIHAEFMAAMNAGFDLSGCTVYVFREHKNGTWAMARPCSSCWKFLMKCGAKRTIYSCNGSFVEEIM